MGSLCSRDSSSEDNFAGPGRTLGHAPPKTTNNTRAPIPSSAKQHHQQPQQQGTPPPPPKVGGQGHVLGSSSDSDPRDAAARAAEARATPKVPKHALEAKLQEERRRGQNTALTDSAEENLRQREIDQAREARSYN